jgi:hypothetical protein
MAIFKVPRITTQNRISLLVEESELLFDTDLKKYYGGDGQTIGGFEVGSTLVLKYIKEKVILSAEQIQNGIIDLQFIPEFPLEVRLIPKHGIEQENGVGYTVVNDQLIFNGYDLDGFLEEGEQINIMYSAFINNS